jgi:exodeoxyribonuclease VII small subunit
MAGSTMNADDPDVSKQPIVSAESTESEPSFEQALARLELIVDRLEQGDLELESALADFEEGVKLTRRCAGDLADAERRIEILVREGEKWISRPFLQADDDEDPEGEEEE